MRTIAFSVFFYVSSYVLVRRFWGASLPDALASLVGFLL
jgi:L-lactate permease